MRVTKHVVEPLGRSGRRVAIRARRAVEADPESAVVSTCMQGRSSVAISVPVEATQQLGVSVQRGLGGGCARRLQQSSGADAHLSAEQLGH